MVAGIPVAPDRFSVAVVGAVAVAEEVTPVVVDLVVSEVEVSEAAEPAGAGESSQQGSNTSQNYRSGKSLCRSRGWRSERL